MNILKIMTVYNEMQFLPYQKKWCDLNGIDLYVIDNMSNDGTFEWLRANKIKTHRIDTGGSFDLKKLQKNILITIKRIKPDWVVYHAADLFTVTEDRVDKEINGADREGYNQIGLKSVNFKPTGESGDIFRDFNYCNIRGTKNLILISKYYPSLRIEADKIFIKNPKIKTPRGCLLHFGNVRGRDKREETYRRRLKAWRGGLIRAWGVHYLTGHNKGWRWNKNELIDVRKTEYYKYLEKFRRWMFQ